MPGPRLAAGCAVVAAILIAPVAANAADASFGRASQDGIQVFFETDERMLPADTDSSFDIYKRAGSTTTLISPGSANLDASLDGASADGAKVLFETEESLVGTDTDNDTDLYLRSGGTTTLISTAPGSGNGDFDAFPDFAGNFFGSGFQLPASQDLAKIIFGTNEQLVSTDIDSSLDLYMRDVAAGTTTIVSDGPNPDDPIDADFYKASATADHVYFQTTEQLVGGDLDAKQDVYDFTGGSPTLVSIGPNGGNGAFDVTLQDISTDGTKALFFTQESLLSEDTDSQFDTYLRSGGGSPTTSRVSQGANSSNGAFDAFGRALSDDGSRAFFLTSEKILSEDTDSSLDSYERSGGTTTRISTGTNLGNAAVDSPLGTFDAISSNGLRAFMETSEPFETGDTDGSEDLYVRDRTGTAFTAILSTGPESTNQPAFFVDMEGSSPDGAHVFFKTNEQLVSGDTDASADIYERFGTTTSLVSTGPAGGNGAVEPSFQGNSSDGSRVFFESSEKLVSSDTDDDDDVYQRSGGTTTLLSVGDLSAPQTTITSGPSGSTSDSTPTFAFSSSEAGSTFQCKLDAGAFAACTSPTTVGPLTNGLHAFEVRAHDAAGNIDASPASRSFTVNAPVNPPPIKTIRTLFLGGDGADVIIGTFRNEKACGGGAGDTIDLAAGDDVLYGGACGSKNPPLASSARFGAWISAAKDGNDKLTGGDGNDRLFGGKGKDKLSGGRGKDKLFGGAGKDKLVGGKGKNSYSAGSGNDTINAANGVKEKVNCGSGRKDKVKADKKDKLKGCEKVKRKKS